MSQAQRARLDALFRATVAGLDPAARVAAALDDAAWSPRAAVVVAAGKAARAMAAGAAGYLRGRGVTMTGVVIAPSQPPGHADHAAPAEIAASAEIAEPAEIAELAEIAAPAEIAELAYLPGSHPVPDHRSVAAARAARDAVAGASHEAEILALISGGASALMALPAPGLTLADKIATTGAVYAAGASIHDLNVVRAHLSAIKGGRLAALAPVPVFTLVSSDVVGDHLATVGSGPTLPDPSTFAQACHIIARAVGWSRISPAVRTHLEHGAAGRIAGAPARPHPGDRAVLVAGTQTLLDQAVAAAARDGLAATVFLRGVTGDVADVARRVAAQARRVEAARVRGPHVFVAGGEPTIVVPEHGGASVGGRAQHLALLLARELAGVQGVTVLVAGSDGIDGNSPAAGAIIDGHTWAALGHAGVDPERAIIRRDSYTALAAVDATLITGPTGINHADLILIAAGD